VTVSGVHIRTIAPLDGEEPIWWFLLTTLPVRTARAAAEAVGHCLQRWRGEDFFRVLKSCCRVEHLLFREAERLQRAMAINAVIAWRIMVMTRLDRQVPDCNPELMFTDAELRFRNDCASQHGLALPIQLGEAVALAPHRGGDRDRRHDPDPGHQILGHGQTRLASAALGHEIGCETGLRDGRRCTLRDASSPRCHAELWLLGRA